MEHALSAYDDITYGVGLAIITNRWMMHVLSEKRVDRFVKYGVMYLELIPVKIHLRLRIRPLMRYTSSLNSSIFLCI